MTGIEGEKHSPSNMAEKYPSDPSDPAESSSEEINQEIIKSLEELESKLDALECIHESFHDIPLICMRESTDMELCFRLDPTTDVPADSGLTKDYRGMAEFSKLDPVFIKYLTKTDSKYKTTDVMAKWSTMETEPIPTLGNLQRCLLGEDGIDRPDVITDLAKRINKDALNWKMDKYRANTKKPEEKDYSWQLTRQDMIVGKRAYYTCCLVYADEDEGMASLITNLFKAVDKDAVFFNPQFDLKMGKYVHASTAQVIEERCGGKVIFIISEYFFASPVCQFTVHFAKGLDMVITGKPTYYTACLVYADEDAGMAEVINKLYTTAYPRATFFRPQFDLRRGKYILETTGRIIQERCGGKAIFLLSEYFFASDVCQFAVNYTASVCKGAGVGNLVPFHLTPKSDHVPAVLKGIAGIRWFRKGTRKFAWQMVTDTILAQELQQEELQSIYERIYQIVDSDQSSYLTDPPYDEDTQPPGEPIKVIEPEGISEFLEQQNKVLQERLVPPKKKLTRMQRLIEAVQKKIFKTLKDDDEDSDTSSSCSPDYVPSKKTDSISSCSPENIPSEKIDSASCDSLNSSESDGDKISTMENGLVRFFKKRIKKKSSNNPSIPNSTRASECVGKVTGTAEAELASCDGIVSPDSIQMSVSENNNRSEQNTNHPGQKTKQCQQIHNQSEPNNNQSESNYNQSEQNNNQSEPNDNKFEQTINQSESNDNQSNQNDNKSEKNVNQSKNVPFEQIICDDKINTKQETENSVNHMEVDNSDQPVVMNTVLETLSPDNHLEVEHSDQSAVVDQCKLDANVDKIPECTERSACSGVEILYVRQKERYYTDSKGRLCSSSEYSNSDTSEDGEANSSKKCHREASEHDESLCD